MSRNDFDTAMLAAVEPLRAAGFALHWLKARDKRPVIAGWSESAVLSHEQLSLSHQSNYNVGVRLGEPSQVAGGFLHVLDIDIRIDDLKDEAWDAVRALFPDVNISELPCVQSGSGGESRHLYLILDKPFRSKLLATSPGKHKRVKDGKEGWSYDWEVELYGTSKQVVVPPSIHPESGKPYRWLRELDFTLLELGVGPFVSSSAIERLSLVEHATYEFETREPLTFKGDQLERTLSAINISELHYNDWLRIGQALHHQFGGSDEGFDLWLKHTKRSTKFTGDKQVREMRRVKWKSFGRYRGKPVTMATVVEWAQDARTAAFVDAFEDADDEAPADFDDLLGADAPAEVPPPKSDIDLLGGADDDDDDTISAKGGWLSLLDRNDEGAIKPTLHNVELMVRNDLRLAGLPQLNEFTLEPVQRTQPGSKPNLRSNPAKQTRQLAGRVWQVKDELNGDLWSEDRDYAVRSIMEAPKTQGGYGVKVTDRDLKASIVLAATDHSFHPVREYLESHTWDGTARVETLFHDYVGAPNDSYSRSVSRLMLIAAVTRIYEPGHKFDFAVILEGLQGKRKSTFIKTLGHGWFAELDGDFHDQKQMIEAMQGAWIMEIPELSGFQRGEVQTIKAFMSRTHDKARLAYARRAGVFPRQCIFLGSTNDKRYLKDDTGARRWWPMPCQLDGEIDIPRLELNLNQLWAEALVLYRAMRATQPSGILPLYLSEREALVTAARLQESRRVESADDATAGRIAEWLSQPINTGSIDDDLTEDGKPRLRTETCLIEVWTDCLGNDVKTYNQVASQSLGRAMALVPDWHLCTIGSGRKRFPRHGQQRFYSLFGDEGYLQRQGLAG
jgi:predicted P-loop ATPase